MREQSLRNSLGHIVISSQALGPVVVETALSMSRMMSTFLPVFLRFGFARRLIYTKIGPQLNGFVGDIGISVRPLRRNRNPLSEANGLDQMQVFRRTRLTVTRHELVIKLHEHVHIVLR